MKKLQNLTVSEMKLGMYKYPRTLLKTVILITIMIQASCANLYKINTVKDITVDTIKTLIQSDKQFIIQSKDYPFIAVSMLP